MLETISPPLDAIVAAQKSGRPVGIVSICSANPYVLRAAARLSKSTQTPLLVESTCNQVNQEGGYLGMTPAQFAVSLAELAGRHSLPPEQLILGGDHLGPYPWKDLPAAQAMDKGRRLVADCVLAGYAKIHLDASMGCADDPAGALPKELIAERAAELCQAAEQAAKGLPEGSLSPCYVIGTEVPPPGGALQDEVGLQVTAPADAEETLALTRQAFLRRGLGAAWERTVALVAQPGVEYGDSTVHAYMREEARPLSAMIERYEGLVYEAHSTDYQTPQALRELVEDHFAILKVGPALTFALREALFALSWMEAEWLEGVPGVELARLPQALEQAMLAEPRHWRPYYHGDLRLLHFARKYSLSDRWRYYWSEPGVQAAVTRLLHNLEAHPVPDTLLSQFLPAQHAKLREGHLSRNPQDWVDDAIQRVLLDYYYACGWEGG